MSDWFRWWRLHLWRSLAYVAGKRGRGSRLRALLWREGRVRRRGKCSNIGDNSIDWVFGEKGTRNGEHSPAEGCCRSIPWGFEQGNSLEVASVYEIRRSIGLKYYRWCQSKCVLFCGRLCQLRIRRCFSRIVGVNRLIYCSASGFVVTNSPEFLSDRW